MKLIVKLISLFENYAFFINSYLSVSTALRTQFTFLSKQI